jgi:hypothetical protein
MAPMSNAPTTRLSRRVTTIRAVFLACLLGLVPQTAPAQLRPLVRDMLDNLSAVERIAEGVALEDWDRIEDAARELRARAAIMRLLDLETLDMDRVKDPAWDGFLVNQERSARAISGLQGIGEPTAQAGAVHDAIPFDVARHQSGHGDPRFRAGGSPRP